MLNNKKVHAYYVPSRKKQAQFYERLAWDKALQWEKRQQMGSNRKKLIVESEVSRAVAWWGGKGGGAWRNAFDAAVPWYQILVSCSDWSLHVDRFVLLLTVSRSFNITLLQFRKRFFKTQISSKQYKFLCETFHLSLGSKKSKKYTCDLLQQEQEAFKIWSFSYTILW